MTKLYERLAGLNAFVGVMAMVIGLAAVPQAVAAVAPATDCTPSCSGCALEAPCGSSSGSCTGNDCTGGCFCSTKVEALTNKTLCYNSCPVKTPLNGND